MTSRRFRDTGSASVELTMLVPVIVLFFALAAWGGRIALAHQSVSAAAHDAARAASISRTVAAAQANARAAATATLASEGIACASSAVSVDTAAFAAPPGTPGMTSATVTCTISYLGLPPRTLTSHARSPLDTYRERT